MPLLRKTSTAQFLALSNSGLTKLVANDPTFPRPIKLGDNRQSAVFFDADEINSWIEAKKAQRQGVAA